MGSTRTRSNDFSITTCANARMRRRDGESTAICAPPSGICLYYFAPSPSWPSAVRELPRWSTAPLAWNPEHTNPPGGLAEYYKRNVVVGPGAFVIVAQDFESFGQAIINKLIGEVALASPPWRTARR
jgi:Protein of unknown function (DUF1194)